MKHTVHVHVVYDGGEIRAMAYDTRRWADSDYVWLAEGDLEVEIPDDFDPRAAEIEVLNKQLQKERADSQVRQNLILERISKLQALEFSGVEA